MATPSTPATINFVQSQPFTLSGSGASIGDITLTLQSMMDIDGNNIVTADLGSFAYGTLEPGNSTQEEAVIFTGITQNANGTATLTGVSSIGFKQPYTLTSGIQKTHAGASKFILSNDAAFYNNLVLYMNSIAGAGAANASTTVKGIVQGATSSQINSGTPTGSTGAILAVTPDALAASNYGTSNIPPSGLISMFGGSSTPIGWLLCDGSAVSRSTDANLFSVISTTYGAGDGSTTFNVPDLRSRVVVGTGSGTKVLTFASLSGNIITVTGAANSTTNEVQTGQGITFANNGGSITGLTTATFYFIIRVTSTSFSLATTLANAYAGTAITLSGSSGNPTFTYALSTRNLADTGGEETHALITTEMPAHTHTSQNQQGTASSSGGAVVGVVAGNTGSTGGSTPHNNIQPFLSVNYIIKQ